MMHRRLSPGRDEMVYREPEHQCHREGLKSSSSGDILGFCLLLLWISIQGKAGHCKRDEKKKKITGGSGRDLSPSLVSIPLDPTLGNPPRLVLTAGWEGRRCLGSGQPHLNVPAAEFPPDGDF